MRVIIKTIQKPFQLENGPVQRDQVEESNGHEWVNVCHLAKKVVFMRETSFKLPGVKHIFCNRNSLALEMNLTKVLMKLTLCMLGKNFSRWHFEIFSLIFLENRI